MSPDLKYINFKTEDGIRRMDVPWGGVPTIAPPGYQELSINDSIILPSLAPVDVITLKLCGFILPSFENVPPNIERLILDGCLLGSFNGIEKLSNLRTLRIECCNSTEEYKTVNLLGLLKAKALTEVSFKFSFLTSSFDIPVDITNVTLVMSTLSLVISRALRQGYDLAETFELLHENGFSNFASGPF